MNKKTAIIAGLVALLVAGACSVESKDSGTTAPTVTVEVTKTPGSVTPKVSETGVVNLPKTNPNIIEEGSWVVPNEVNPGEYTTTVPDGQFSLCLWKRLGGFSGSGDDIIAIGTGTKGERVRVTIKATDKGFSSTGCGTWTKA